MTTTLSDLDMATFGELLIQFDKEIDHGDRLTYESAYNQNGPHMDPKEQREKAMSPAFTSPQKEERDRLLRYRNVVAKALGFRERTPHQWGYQDYKVREGRIVFE